MQVIVDYGHGGIVEGKYATAGKQYLHTSVIPNIWIGEGIINRMVAAEFIRACVKHGVKVFDCVAKKRWKRAPTWLELEQRDISLAERVQNANEIQRDDKNAAFISIHSNAQGNASSGDSLPAYGASVFTSVGQTRSDDLANEFYVSLKANADKHKLRIRPGDWSDGDEDHESNFYVLRNTVGPAVLIEAGFFDNVQDARKLMSRETQRGLGLSYFQSVLRWLESEK